MKKLFLTLLVGMFMLSTASALGDIGAVKQHDSIDLYNYCPTCTYINLTAVSHPNGTIETMNLAMVKTTNNYVYNYGGTDLLGDYSYTTCGNKFPPAVLCEDITFEVTSTGGSSKDGADIAFTFVIIIFSLGIVILGLSLRDPTVTILGSFGLYFVGLYTILYGIVGIQDTTYTMAISAIVLGLAAYISIKSAYELIVD